MLVSLPNRTHNHFRQLGESGIDRRPAVAQEIGLGWPVCCIADPQKVPVEVFPLVMVEWMSGLQVASYQGTSSDGWRLL